MKGSSSMNKLEKNTNNLISISNFFPSKSLTRNNSSSPIRKLQIQSNSRLHEQGKKYLDRKEYLRAQFERERTAMIESTTFR